MENKHLLTTSVALLFLMLWLPLGQQDFLINHWMKIGTYAVPFILIGVFLFLGENYSFKKQNHFRLIALLMLLAYILHQFEEHWIDLFGNHYAFYTYNNNFIRTVLSETDSSINPLSKASVFVINTSLVWLLGFLAIWRSPKHLFPLFSMAGIIVVNAFVHILAAVVNFTYNPGLLTSLLIFVPCYGLFARYILKKYPLNKKNLFSGLLWAFLAHVIMIGGMLAANYYNVISELFYFGILVAWSIIPVFVFNDKTISDM
ncbi:HXXEE domain-containing protein [uncultured Aquimarina sp.]|uniref:HXXEE domain-containing protein n=1 Tax=uncultured Aquimarina sp. TaxID=575652 RepID=UPI00260D27FB|nr:HXXEE domain-containing protein [uncultured Aquimarina sp.]